IPAHKFISGKGCIFRRPIEVVDTLDVLALINLSYQRCGQRFSTSICFDMSVFEIFGPLSWGGRAIIVNNALDVSGIASAEGVTLIDTVPSAMAELVRMGAVPDTVQTVNLGGEALPTALVRQVYQIKNIKRVYNLY